MVNDPRTADEFVAAAVARPGLVDALNNGSIDAFVEYLEIAPGAKVEQITSRTLAAQ